VEFLVQLSTSINFKFKAEMIGILKHMSKKILHLRIMHQSDWH